MAKYSLRHEIKKKSNSLFLLYFLSFFLVILTPVAFLSISSYNLVISTVQDEISQANMNALRQTGSSVNRLLNEINTLSIQLGLDGRVYASSRSPEDSFLLNDVKDRIQGLASENMHIYMIQLYFKKNNQVISSEGPNRYYFYEPFDQWIDTMDKNPKANSLWLPVQSIKNHDGNSVRILTLVRKLPVAFPDTTGYIAIHIYEDDLIALLKPMDINNDHNLYITKPTGEIVTAYTPVEALTDRQSLIGMTDRLISGQEGSYFDTSNNHAMLSYSGPNPYGWHLVAETPMDYLYQKLHYTKKMILLSGMIIILLGIAVSYYLSRTMYNPIKQLLEKTRRYQKELSLPYEAEGNSFKYVSGLFEHVVGKHKALEASYKANYQAMVDRFIFTVLYNRFNDSFDMEEKIEYLKLPITTTGYHVMILEIDHYAAMTERYSAEDLNLFRFALNNIAQEVIGKAFNCLSTEINDHQIAMLINTLESDSSVNESLKELGKEIIRDVEKYLKFSISVSVGEYTEHIHQAHLSFNQAADVIRYKVLLGHNHIIFYHDMNVEKSVNYYYPVQLEKTIINNIQAGNEDKVSECLNTLKEEISGKLNLSHENIFRIYNRLLDAAIDLLFEANLTLGDVFDSKYNVHEELAKRETVESISAWLENVFIRFIGTLKENTPHHTKVEQAIEYMNTHYHQDLSIDYIAESVDLNSAYLSRIFKSTTGKTILEYLTLIRINESKRLLADTKDTINEIAQKVGYNNINSFIRFFRKYEGITPGEYRKTQQNP